MREKLSVILPAYRELENLKLLIPALFESLKDRDFEIVVVDDDGNDGTREFLEHSTDRRLRYLLRKNTRGLGSAVLHGIERSEGSLLAVMDSDLNHDPADLGGMLDRLDSADFVSGSRFLKGSRSDYRLRTGLSRLFNGFIRSQRPSRLTDHLFGLCVFRRSVLKGIRASEVFYGDGDYYMRLLYSLERAGVSIAEYPAHHRKRHSGTGNRRFLRTAWVYFNAVRRLGAERV